MADTLPAVRFTNHHQDVSHVRRLGERWLVCGLYGAASMFARETDMPSMKVCPKCSTRLRRKEGTVMIRLGKLLVWPNMGRDGLDPGLSVHWGGRRLIWVRLGKRGWRSFTERYQGQHGFPVVWRYYFNGWLSVCLGSEDREER